MAHGDELGKEMLLAALAGSEGLAEEAAAYCDHFS